MGWCCDQGRGLDLGCRRAWGVGRGWGWGWGWSLVWGRSWSLGWKLGLAQDCSCC